MSQYVAANRKKGRAVFQTGLIIALGLSVLMAWALYSQASPLATYILLEPRCAPYIPLIAVSVPFAALHACICGYYYGMQKTRIPALSQVAEQIVRMGAVFLIAGIWAESGREVTVSLAVYGHLIGEMAASGFVLFCLGFFPPKRQDMSPAHSAMRQNPSQTHPLRASDPQAERPGQNSFSAACARRPFFAETFSPLMVLALPLMGSRLILNLLGSAEAVLIPNRLMGYGLTNSQALSVYGVLTSMALPFVLFPSAITNSMAVLLLPSVAQAQADGNEGRISSMISMSLRYSCYMGILCIGIFTLFGNQLGTGVFGDSSAGLFITILSWLCPFMYLATTMGSILNGLGRTSDTFLFNTAAMVIRLAFVLFGIPRFGIYGYLLGMLVSELALALMCFLAVRRLVPFRWDSLSMIAKPALLLLLSIGIYLAASCALPLPEMLPVLIRTLIHTGFISLCYLGLLLVFHKGNKLP